MNSHLGNQLSVSSMTESVESALPELERALEVSRNWLSKNVPESRTYRQISNRDTRETHRRVGEWISSGGVGAAPDLNALAHRATIYELGSTSAQFQAYCTVCALISSDLIDASMVPLRSRKLAIALPMLRGLLERTAAAASLSQHVEPLLNEARASKHIFETVLSISDIVANTLHGTKIDWRTVSAGKFEAMSSKDIKYRAVEHSVNLTAKQILNAVDSLDDLIPGTRIAYDVLCEFLHPNIGDIFSVTLKSGSFEDSFGTRHLEFSLGRGAADLHKSVDVDRALAKAISTLTNVVVAIPAIHSKLRMLADQVYIRTRKTLHAQVKKNRPFFPGNDPCPCGSGKTIRNCYLRHKA